MGANDPLGMAKGLIGRVYVGDHWVLLILNIQEGPISFT